MTCDRLFAEYLNAGDLEGLMTLYEPGCSSWRVGSVAAGHDEIRVMLGRLVEMRPAFRTEAVKVVGTGHDLALVYSDWSMAVKRPDGTLNKTSARRSKSSGADRVVGGESPSTTRSRAPDGKEVSAPPSAPPPRRRLPRRAAHDGMRDAGHEERRAPVPVAILRQLQVPALTMQSHGDQADAGPRVESLVQEAQLGRAWRELEEAEGGAEGGDAAITHVVGAARTPARCLRSLR